MQNISREGKYICPDKHTLDGSVFLSIEPRACNILLLYVTEQTRVRKHSLTLEEALYLLQTRVDLYLLEIITLDMA